MGIRLRGTYSAVGAVLGLVEGPHPQATDVARRVVAGSDGVVRHGVCADEADVGVVVSRVVLCRCCSVVRGPLSGGSIERLPTAMGSRSGGGNVPGCWVQRLGVRIVAAIVTGVSAASSTSSCAAASVGVVGVAASAASSMASSRAVASSGLRGSSFGSRHGHGWALASNREDGDRLDFVRGGVDNRGGRGRVCRQPLSFRTDGAAQLEDSLSAVQSPAT